MLNANAGKPRFATLTSKYEKSSDIDTLLNNDIKNDSKNNNTKMENQVAEIIKNVTESIDSNIKKRHAAYKGARVTRTYRIPKDLDDRMHKVLESEGIIILKQVEKAMVEWLDKYYPLKN